MDLAAFTKESQAKKIQNAQFYKALKSKNPRQLDDAFHSTHEDVFAVTDCLSCANCCKTTSPIFYQRDIERAAHAVKMKPGEFIDRYLKIDSDGDYVLRTAPCPFLHHDNYCGIYNDRPAACREYPHTNRKKMYQLLDLTMRNTLVCPAVLSITEKLKDRLKV